MAVALWRPERCETVTEHRIFAVRLVVHNWEYRVVPELLRGCGDEEQITCEQTLRLMLTVTEI